MNQNAFLMTLSAQEYLDFFCMATRQNSYAAGWERVLQNQDKSLYHTEEGELKKLFPTPESHEELMKSLSPDKAQNGLLVTSIREICLKLLVDRYPALAEVPVALAPTGELQAMALRVPSGGYAIVLNHGWTITLGSLSHFVFECLTFHSSPKKGTFAEYAQGVIDIALFMLKNDMYWLTRNASTNRLSRAVLFDQVANMSAVYIEIFLMFHEYGHVALGHFDDASLRCSHEIPVEGEVCRFEGYTLSQQQEFEADAFAISAMRSLLIDEQSAVYIGMFFHLVDLCGYIAAFEGFDPGDSHPPARERWEAVKRQLGITIKPQSLPHGLEDLFGLIKVNLEAHFEKLRSLQSS